MAVLTLDLARRLRPNWTLLLSGRPLLRQILPLRLRLLGENLSPRGLYSDDRKKAN